MRSIYTLTVFFQCINFIYLLDYEVAKSTISTTNEDLEFEPIVPMNKDKEKHIVVRNINCENFSKYAVTCTLDAALIYNSSRKAPPLPSKVYDWCRAIRHLTNCAIDWNSDCKDVTDSHFNEDSIRGHMHVVSNVCDDEWFLAKYDLLGGCVEGTIDIWENCYNIFKTLVDEQKNTTHEWTHYDTHFHMCCARAQFRRCTLDALFDMPVVCPYEHAVTLQKFSVIVSEGDVFQECNHNMMYANCPGGDPRPTSNSLPSQVSLDGRRDMNKGVTLEPIALLLCVGHSVVCVVL